MRTTIVDVSKHLVIRVGAAESFLYAFKISCTDQTHLAKTKKQKHIQFRKVSMSSLDCFSSFVLAPNIVGMGQVWAMRATSPKAFKR